VVERFFRGKTKRKTMHILANDGIDAVGRAMLEEAGHTVLTEKVAQDRLADFLVEHKVVAIIVRSATEVTARELGAGTLKVVGRAGVGLDNIDLVEAERLGIAVVNTSAASSRSVAELVIAHALGLMRFLPESNREMPGRGSTDFAKLKKSFAKGRELEGRTFGVIGFGRIGQATAKLALGLGMRVVGHDTTPRDCPVRLHVHGFGEVTVNVPIVPLNELLGQSDIISLHVPGRDGAVIGREEFGRMKEGAVIINAARGGVVDEEALLEALEGGRLAGAGLDVFCNEPTPDPRLLAHPRISVTPHTGASTMEAQERIGIELAERVLEVLGSEVKA
jgi:D-3-phosphoglycerate dehydrogenase